MNEGRSGSYIGTVPNQYLPEESGEQVAENTEANGKADAVIDNHAGKQTAKYANNIVKFTVGFFFCFVWMCHSSIDMAQIYVFSRLVCNNETIFWPLELSDSGETLFYLNMETAHVDLLNPKNL